MKNQSLKNDATVLLERGRWIDFIKRHSSLKARKTIQTQETEAKAENRLQRQNHIR